MYAFDDMTFADINPRIIAMGFPSENMEAVYRNPLSEVYRYPFLSFIFLSLDSSNSSIKTIIRFIICVKNAHMITLSFIIELQSFLLKIIILLNSI